MSMCLTFLTVGETEHKSMTRGRERETRYIMRGKREKDINKRERDREGWRERREMEGEKRDGENERDRWG